MRKTATALAAFLLITTGACGTDDGRPPATESGQSRSEDPVSPALLAKSKMSGVSRAQEFTTIRELAKASDLVVTARTTDKVTPDEISDASTPFADVTIRITEVIKGDVAADSTVQLLCEGHLDDSGKIATTKVAADQEYLLFLTQFRPGEDVYAVTGYYSGLYQQLTTPQKSRQAAANEDEYGKVDPESPRLPHFLTVEDVKAEV